MFPSEKAASKNWPRIVYGLALSRLSAWIILITFCVVCFESSVVELNRIIRESRPHFEGLTVDQTRDFLIVYLIFGVLYVLIDGKLEKKAIFLPIRLSNVKDAFNILSATHANIQKLTKVEKTMLHSISALYKKEAC